ncbi:MAG: hypothetical protein KGL02_04655 [Acidobacteriota bacterium]|nr:hypothetical protein [Acidobacteriota bacterium]
MTRSLRCATISAAILLFAAGAALFAPAAHAQDQVWFVVRAVYGHDSRQTDVTDLVRDFVSRGGVNGRIAVGNQTMGGDPAIGKDKTLRIYAKNRAGDQREFDFREGSFVPVQMFAVPDRNWDHPGDRDQYGDQGYQADREDRDDRPDRDDRDGFRDRDHQRLQILWGFYGVQRQTANVTGLLQNMVDDGRLTVQVGNATMGGDPAVGADKVLIVVYRYRGVEQAAAVPEGGVLSIP